MNCLWCSKPLLPFSYAHKKYHKECFYEKSLVDKRRNSRKYRLKHRKLNPIVVPKEVMIKFARDWEEAKKQDKWHEQNLLTNSTTM